MLSETENFRLIVTPSILIDSTRLKPEISDGGSDWDAWLLGLINTISTDLS